MNTIIPKYQQRALSGDALDMAIIEQRRSSNRSSVKEYLLRYNCFFHDYNEVKLVLGEKTFGLNEIGERIVREPEEGISIGKSSVKLIDCFSKIKDYILTVLELEIESSDVPYIPFSHHSEYLTQAQLSRYQMILGDVLCGNCFYEEVKLIIANESIDLIQIKQKSLDRPIEINGETYLFRLVLSSVLNCFTEYEYVYDALYYEEREERMRKKREELRRKLKNGEDIAIEKNEVDELPLIPNERFV